MKYNYEIIFRGKWGYDGCTSFKDIFERIENKKKYFEKMHEVLSKYGEISINVEDDYGFISICCEKSIPQKIVDEYNIDIVESDAWDGHYIPPFN